MYYYVQLLGSLEIPVAQVVDVLVPWPLLYTWGWGQATPENIKDTIVCGYLI